ncbi:MAG: hypothetical protein Q9163_002935 [Psora crenata]
MTFDHILAQRTKPLFQQSYTLHNLFSHRAAGADLYDAADGALDLSLSFALSLFLPDMSTPSSAGGKPTSFKTNVNRAKTKRWVEAKSYSYDGGDWGDVEEYDTYGRYNEPPSLSGPTGFRQRGQAAIQMPEENAGQDTHYSSVDHRSPLPISIGTPSAQQVYENRPATSQPPQHLSDIRLSGSIEDGDQRTAFSTAMPPQVVSNASSQMHPTVQQGQDIQAHIYQPKPGHPKQSSPIQIPNSRGVDDPLLFGGQQEPAGDKFQDVHPDDHSRVRYGGSRSQSLNSNTSSLDFHNRRDFSPSAVPPPLQTRNSPSSSTDPWTRPPRKSSLSQQTEILSPFDSHTPPLPASIENQGGALQKERASDAASATNPKPFIRPADIYKRIEEERKRERLSQESVRPSLDANSREPNKQPSFDTNNHTDLETRTKPELDLVTKCNTENRTEVLHVGDDSRGNERPPTTSKRFELKKPSELAPSPGPPFPSKMMLPDPTRVSGFGEGFGDSFIRSDDAFERYSRSPTLSPLEDDKEANAHGPVGIAQMGHLQHQPSKGFKSAVHQAFDTAQDQNPPTPSSTTDSSIVRSGSESTNAVSPIISRGPSAVDRERHNELPSIDDISTPTEDKESEKLPSRHRSAGSFGTLTQASLSQAVQEVTGEEMPPPGFVPGHRRDLSTPSPDNNLSKTPELVSMRHLKQPQAVDLAETTPTPTELVPSPSNSFPDPYPSSIHTPKYIESHASPTPTFRRQRTESAGSGRVRDLADKFESNSRPGSGHSNSTPRASMLGSGSPTTDDLIPPRPTNQRIESFRPHVPGGWESSASIAPASGSSQPTHLQGRERHSQASISMPEKEQPSGLTQIKDASSNAFAAATEAGNALAGALVAAVGSRNEGSSKDKATARNHAPVTRNRASSGDTVVHSSATELPMHQSMDDDAVAPMPLLKDPQRNLEDDVPRSDHLASSKTETRDDLSTVAVPSVTQQPMPLPALSTNLQSSQYESDRLRREIARELNPDMRSEPSTAEADSPYQASSKYTTADPLSGKSRESGTLPSEYDSYWNDNSDDTTSEFSGEAGQIADATIVHPEQQGAVVVGNSPAQGHAQATMTTEHTVPQPLIQDETHVLQHRYSWEQPLADLASQPQERWPTAKHDVQPQPTSDFPRSQFYPKGHFVSTETDAPDNFKPIPEQKTSESPDTILKTNAKSGPIIEVEKTNPRDSVDRAKEPPSHTVGSDAAPTFTENRPSESWEQQDTSGVSLLKRQSLASQQENAWESPSIRNALPPPIATPQVVANTRTKIPSFREIMALKTALERIRAFNDAQQQFRELDTGLAHWLVATTHTLPEHGEIVINQDRDRAASTSHKASPSRSKLIGFIPTGGQPGQSTSQQYFDASPHLAKPGNTALGGTVGQSSTRGSSPSRGSGSKSSSQQVQAKSKEFLHSAGVFGGKANVAAKGLFSKGKSKLRDASGSKKITANAALVLPTETAELLSTQSQLADDERSEDSAVNSSQHLGDSSKEFHSKYQDEVLPMEKTQDAPRASDSQGCMPKHKQSLGSTITSNKTPTQASFDIAAITQFPTTFQASDTVFKLRDGLPAVTTVGSTESRDSYEKSRHTTKLLHFTQSPTRINGGASASSNVERSQSDEPGCGQLSQQLEATFKIDTGLGSFGPPDNPQEHVVRYADGTYALDVQQEPDHILPQGSKSANLSTDERALSIPRLPLPIHAGFYQLRPSQGFLKGRPSTDSLGSRIDPEGPPSPVSPQLPIQMTPHPHDRHTVPVHYGVDNDFGLNLPKQETNPPSPRSSKSSALFNPFAKSIGGCDNPTAPESFALCHNSSPAASPVSFGKKNKSSSAVRLRKGQMGFPTDKTRSNVDVARRATYASRSPPVTLLPSPATPKTAVDEGHEEYPLRQKQRTSIGLSEKLRRSSTSANREEEAGKRRRSSVMGSLFGRSRQKRQSPIEQSLNPHQHVLPPYEDVSRPYQTPAMPTRQVLEDPSVISGSKQPPQTGYYAPKRGPSSETAPLGKLPYFSQGDTPAYFQDVFLRQPTSLPPFSIPLKPAADFVKEVLQPVHGDRVSQWGRKAKGSSWARFSKHASNKSQSTSTSAPVAEELAESQYNSYESPHTPADRAPQQPPPTKPLRPESPLPPPPPPKDDWHRPKPSSPSPSFTASRQHHQSLPPLQTNVPQPDLGLRRYGASVGDSGADASGGASSKELRLEERRKNRQQEIEKGHLSPSSARTSIMNKVSAVHDGEERQEDEPVVMSATSFPGQEWRPDYDHGWMGD